MIGIRIVTAVLSCYPFRVSQAVLLSQELSLPETGKSPAGDPPTEADRILSASYFSGSFSINSYFHLYSSDGQVLFDAREFWTGDEYAIDAKPVDHNALEELQVLILDNGVIHWDGFSEQADDVDDGYSFSLSVEYESVKHLIASGYERELDNYEPGHVALVNFFQVLWVIDDPQRGRRRRPIPTFSCKNTLAGNL